MYLLFFLLLLIKKTNASLSQAHISHLLTSASKQKGLDCEQLQPSTSRYS